MQDKNSRYLYKNPIKWIKIFKSLKGLFILPFIIIVFHFINPISYIEATYILSVYTSIMFIAVMGVYANHYRINLEVPILSSISFVVLWLSFLGLIPNSLLFTLAYITVFTISTTIVHGISESHRTIKGIHYKRFFLRILFFTIFSMFALQTTENWISVISLTLNLGFLFWIIFDISYNSSRGLSPFYTGKTALLDKFGRLVFSKNPEYFVIFKVVLYIISVYIFLILSS